MIAACPAVDRNPVPPGVHAILSRAGLTRAEAQILIGLTQQIEEFARYGPPKRSTDEDNVGRQDAEDAKKQRNHG